MPKKVVSINKVNQFKLNKWYKAFLTQKIENVDFFKEEFENIILNEIKVHKDCTEKMIVQFYIDSASDVIRKELQKLTENFKNSKEGTSFDIDSASDVIRKELENTEEEKLVTTSDIFTSICFNARKGLAAKYTSNQTYNNNIDIYFNDVKREYIMHPMNESDSLEFLPENRDIFIKNNLKLVVSCAKRYRGLGLPFEDLIQIGNCGLLVAFERFDKNRANLRKSITRNIDSAEVESFTYEDACNLVSKSFTYDKDLERTIKRIPKEGFSSKEEFSKWVMTNVKTAVFASVAFQWIRAYILFELNKSAALVKTVSTKAKFNKLKKEIEDESILKELESQGYFDEPTGTTTISLDSFNPHTNNYYHDNQIISVSQEDFLVEDNAIDTADNEKLFKNIINKAIIKLSDVNRRIVKKRFGIGYPSALSINDISDSEGIAVNRVKYIITTCLKEMRNNISADDLKLLMEILGTKDIL